MDLSDLFIEKSIEINALKFALARNVFPYPSTKGLGPVVQN